MPLRKSYQIPNAVIVRNFGKKCKGKNAFRVLRSGFSARDEQASAFSQKLQITNNIQSPNSKWPKHKWRLYLNPLITDRP